MGAPFAIPQRRIAASRVGLNVALRMSALGLPQWASAIRQSLFAPSAPQAPWRRILPINLELGTWSWRDVSVGQ